MKRRKLYIIGVDSAPLWLLEKLSKSKEMSGFNEFFKHGILTEIESTLPPVTAAAWPSIYSGLLPAAHGIIDFIFLDKNYTKQLIYYNEKRAPPFWDLLAAHGIKSLVVTPPMIFNKTSHPNVDLVTGWPLDPKFSSKELERLAKKYGFSGDPDIGVDLDNGKISLKSGSEKYAASIRARAQMSEELIEKNDYDLVFVCFTETDRIQHYALNNEKSMEYIVPLYHEVSKFIEWILDYTRKNNEQSVLMLVSDHGAQPITNKFLVNSYLIDKQYAILNAETESKMNDEQSGVAPVKKYISERIMKLKFRRAVYNRMPAGMKKAAERFINDSLEAGSGNYIKIYETNFAMEKTKAFAAISYGPVGMIWINDNRFSNPGISTGDAKKLKSRLMNELESLRCEDGDKLIKNVYDGRKYYDGLDTCIVPDILFELRDNYIVDFGYYAKDGLFMKPEIYRSGDHTRYGIFGIISNDKNVKISLFKKEKLSVENIGPTVLKYFGHGAKMPKGLSLFR